MAGQGIEFDLFGSAVETKPVKFVKAQSPARAEFRRQVSALIAQAEAEDPEKGFLIQEALDHEHRDENGEFFTMEEIAERSPEHMAKMLNKLRNVI